MQLDTSRSQRTKEVDISDLRDAVEPYIVHLQEVVATNDYQSPESVLNTPADKEQREIIKQTIDKKNISNLKVVFLIGIGGSSLSVQAVHQALCNRYGKKLPELVLLDAISAYDIASLQKEYNGLSPEEYLLFIVSKSGTTVETVANTEFFVKVVGANFAEITERMIVISDSKSTLYNQAETLGISTLSLPEVVGGRFSVFTAVGLAPLYALGIDIDDLCAGAVAAIEEGVKNSFSDNQSLQSALYLFHYYQKGFTIHDSFYFSNRLEGIGKWYRQLFAESLGKAKNRYNESVQVGMVPTVSIGSVDLHSIGQLYMSGPPTMFTSFLFVKPSKAYTISEPRFLGNILPELTDVSSNDINRSIEAGVLDAYNDKQRPYLVENLSEITPYEIGNYMQYKIIEVLYLAVLLEINPFDQPGVESYKSHTREHLKQIVD